MTRKNGGKVMVKSSAPAEDRPEKQNGDEANRKMPSGPDFDVQVISATRQKMELVSVVEDNRHIAPELIARISTFMSIANSEVMNTCLAVGPRSARAIRQTYLKNNSQYYLWNALKRLLQKPRSREVTNKCRDDYRAWMRVNPDWKRLCTKKMMKRLQRVVDISVSGAGSLEVNGIYTMTTEICDGLPVYRMRGTWRGRPCSYCLFRCRQDNTMKRWFLSIVPTSMTPGTTEDLDFYSTRSDDGPLESPPGRRWIRGPKGLDPPPRLRGFGCIHPLATFNSPGIAIELGLNEILRFHVEERNIDVNAYFPSLFGDEPCHLLAVAMDADNIEAFRFLSSHDDVDMMRTANANTSLFEYAWAAAKMNGYADCFIRTLIEHQSFDANTDLIAPRGHSIIRPLDKCIHELESCMEDLSVGPKKFVLSVLLMLLERGGDPEHPGDRGKSPWRVAYDHYMYEKRRSRTLPPGNQAEDAAGKTMLWGKVAQLLRDPAAGLNRWKELNRDTRKFFFPHLSDCQSNR